MQIIIRVKWIELDGTMYKKPSTLVLRNNESEDYPTFGKLLDIFLTDSKVYFEVQEYTTLEFNSHFHCFTVQLSSVKRIVSQNQLFSHYPHQIRPLPCNNGVLCIIPKHHFVSS